MTDDNDVYAAAQYREHQDGYGVRDADSHEHAGVVRDAEVSRFLSIQAEEFDPIKADDPSRMPGTAEGLAETKQIRAIEATEAGRQAMESGDTLTLKHLTGDQDQRADISGLNAISKIDEIIDSPAPVVVMLGTMGMGKTDMAGLIAQRKAAKCAGAPLVASNIKTLKETTPWVQGEGVVRDGRAVIEGDGGPAEGEVRSGWVRDFPTFKEWMEQDGDPVHNDQREKIFIGDEFSVSAGGQGSQGYQTATKLAKAIYLARKYRVTLIIIAHGPKSVHPLAWRVGSIIKKTAKKKAKIAEKIKGGSIAGVSATIEGVPPTDWRFSTDDTAPWSWSRSGDTDDETEPDEIARNVAIWTVGECKSDGLSHRDTANYVPYGKDWVADRWDEIQDGEHQMTIDMVEELTA